jgi:hypothetical protein
VPNKTAATFCSLSDEIVVATAPTALPNHCAWSKNFLWLSLDGINSQALYPERGREEYIAGDKLCATGAPSTALGRNGT